MPHSVHLINGNAIIVQVDEVGLEGVSDIRMQDGGVPML